LLGGLGMRLRHRTRLRCWLLAFNGSCRMLLLLLTLQPGDGARCLGRAVGLVTMVGLVTALGLDAVLRCYGTDVYGTGLYSTLCLRATL
jgi:hypothetical protein